MKICHFSDLHIRNLKYGSQYRKILGAFVETVKKTAPDCIVFTGDLAHSKTNISPEYVELASWLLKQLVNIAETICVVGNHDGVCRNHERQDAITPIVQTIKDPDLRVLRASGEYKMCSLPSNLVFNSLSIFDKENWIKPSNPDLINIALFHGPIIGTETDVGWVMSAGEPISILDGHDYAFLGDIHKPNQVVDAEGRFRYPGSLIQQNFGEDVVKGFLLWDIISKDIFTCDFVEVFNPNPFITINLTPKGRLPKIDTLFESGLTKIVVENGRCIEAATKEEVAPRLRLVTEENLSFDSIHKVVELAKSKLSPESVNFINGNVRQLTDDVNNEFYFEDLRNVSVQERLIDTLLKQYEVPETLWGQVKELNTKYNSMIDLNDDVNRNTHWNIKKFEWDNLYNYGKGNSIDFSKLNGIVGCLGKNYSGKSNFIESLLYTIFNSSSKNTRKNYNIINQNKNSGRGKVEIECGDYLYYIERRSDKYDRNLHGKTTQEAKTDVNFWRVHKETEETENLNGESRNDTDKEIRKMFGTIEDFLLTSMASQFGSLSFISEGSTRRKEILAKFLDLDMFERKFKLAKEDAYSLKSVLKRYENKNFKQDIWDAQAEIKTAESRIKETDEQLETTKTQHSTLSARLSELAWIPDVTEKELNAFQTRKTEVDTLRAQLDQLENEKKTYDLSSVDEYNDLRVKMGKTRAMMESALKQEDQIKNQMKILDEVPCENKFPTCRFIKDVNESVARLKEILEEKEKIKVSHKIIKDRMEVLEPIVERLKQIGSDIAEIVPQIERMSKKLGLVYEEIKKYEQSKSKVENLSELLEERKDVEKERVAVAASLESLESELYRLHRVHGSAQQKYQTAVDKKNEIDNYRKEYDAYELFLKCTHSGGISFEIIKNKLPIINKAIDAILVNVVNFRVFFENNENRLDIFIQHPKYEKRPLELGSGAEKALASMAIRIAFIMISTLSATNLVVLDEPAVELDETHVEGFIQILQVLKEKFETIIVISHLESLKEAVETHIGIDVVGKYAHISQ